MNIPMTLKLSNYDIHHDTNGFIKIMKDFDEPFVYKLLNERVLQM